MTDESITRQECTAQVKLMARRAALLHYFFSKTLVEALGEEEGMRLVQQTTLAYGEYCGRAILEGVKALGLPNTQQNFDKIPDLPHYGWDMDVHTLPGGEQRPIVRSCPLAEVFMQFGEEGMRLGRLYCYVDQGKQLAYNPAFDFIHTKNVLDGDPYCEFLIQPHKD
jgi:hypothetical protein